MTDIIVDQNGKVCFPKTRILSYFYVGLPKLYHDCRAPYGYESFDCQRTRDRGSQIRFVNVA